MIEGFLADGAKEALVDSVKKIEERTSAEIVVAARSRSGRYLHVEVIVGLLFAFGTLGFMLLSNFEFGLVSIWLDPFAAGIIAGLVTTQIDPLHRLLTPRRFREDHARVVAQSIFYERGIRHTQERTGVLVFFSLLERVAVLVADSGVATAIEDEDWSRASRAVDDVVAAGGNGHDAAKAMLIIGDVLEPVLPRSEFDVNELPDEVDA